MPRVAAGADDAPAGSVLPPSGPCAQCSAPASMPLATHPQLAPAPARAAPGQGLQPVTLPHALQAPTVSQPARHSSSGESGGSGSSGESRSSGGSGSSGQPGPAPAAAPSAAAQPLPLLGAAAPPPQQLPGRPAARRSSSGDSLSSAGSSSAVGSGGGSARSASSGCSAAAHSAADEGEGDEHDDSDSEDGVRLGRREALQGEAEGAPLPELSSPLAGAGSPSGAAAARRAQSGPLPQAGPSLWAHAAQHMPAGAAEVQAGPLAAAAAHAAALAGSSGAPRRPVRRSLFPEDVRARTIPGSAAARAAAPRAPGIDWGDRGGAPGTEQGSLAGVLTSRGGDHRGATGGVWALAAHRGHDRSGGLGRTPPSLVPLPTALSPPGGFRLAWQLRPRGSDPEARADAAEAQGAAGARGTDPGPGPGPGLGPGQGSRSPALDMRSSMSLQPESSMLVAPGSAPTDAGLLARSPPCVRIAGSAWRAPRQLHFPGPCSSAMLRTGRGACCSCSAGGSGGSCGCTRCACGGRPQPRPLARRQAAHAQAAAGATALPPLPVHCQIATFMLLVSAQAKLRRTMSVAGTRRCVHMCT